MNKNEMSDQFAMYGDSPTVCYVTAESGIMFKVEYNERYTIRAVIVTTHIIPDNLGKMVHKKYQRLFKLVDHNDFLSMCEFMSKDILDSYARNEHDSGAYSGRRHNPHDVELGQKYYHRDSERIGKTNSSDTPRSNMFPAVESSLGEFLDGPYGTALKRKAINPNYNDCVCDLQELWADELKGIAIGNPTTTTATATIATIGGIMVNATPLSPLLEVDEGGDKKKETATNERHERALKETVIKWNQKVTNNR